MTNAVATECSCSGSLRAARNVQENRDEMRRAREASTAGISEESGASFLADLEAGDVGFRKAGWGVS